MRINQGKRYSNSPPYNEVYDAFAPFFLNLLQQRQPFETLDDLTCYVRVPRVESRLTQFVESGSSELCLFSGQIGIGKSSILRYLQGHVWKHKPATESILIDLSRRNASIGGSMVLPEGFFNLSLQEQKHHIRSSVINYLATEIESHIVKKIDLRTEVNALYTFFKTNNGELLQPHGLFDPVEDDERIDLLRVVQTQNRIAFLFVLLKYYAVRENLSQMVMIVDNCDQKDQVVVECFVDSLCHLDRCFEHIEGDYDIVPRFTSIVSCRPSTQSFLEKNRHVNALGSHGWKVIQVDSPCSLAELIKLRFQESDSKHRLNEVRVTSKNGILWETSRHDIFLQKLCESLEKYTQGPKLNALCNYNIADALAAMVDILSNRYFIDLDRIIGDVVDDEAQGESGIAWPSVLRTLAYGNPAEDPVYPIQGTRVPNLLSSRECPFPTTFMLPRFLQLLVMRQRENSGESIEALSDYGTSYFSRQEAITLKLLDHMHDHGLVDTNRGSIPSSLEPSTVVWATPRAVQLWTDLSNSDVLLSCFRDDLELSKRHAYSRVSTYHLKRQQRFYELLATCEDSFDGELREIKRMTEPDYDSFANFFGRTWITEIILSGLGTSLVIFYERYASSAEEVSEMTARFTALSDSVSNAKRLVENSDAG